MSAHGGVGWVGELLSCVNGHPWTPENTRIDATRGHRRCRACDREKRRRQRGSKPMGERVNPSVIQPLDLTGPCAEHPEWFYPERSDRASVAKAKALCLTCPVLAQCRDYALSIDERHGVWGGLTELDRAKLRSAKRRDPSAVQQ